MTKLPPQRYKGEWRGPVTFACRVCGFKGCTRMEIKWRFTHLNIIRPAKEREDDDFFPLSPSNPLFLLLFASVPASGSKWEMKAKHETAPLPQCARYNMTLSRFLSKCARKKLPSLSHEISLVPWRFSKELPLFSPCGTLGGASKICLVIFCERAAIKILLP